MRGERHNYSDGRDLVPPAGTDSTHQVVFETDGRVVERFRAGQLPQVRRVEGCSLRADADSGCPRRGR